MKRALSILLVLVMLCGLLPTVAAATEAVDASLPENDNLLRMWYTKPGVRSNWQTDALVIGNGYMGGMVFGALTKDKVHFNEKTIWAGGPTDNNNYIYGNRSDYDQEQTLKDLQNIREQLDNKSQYVFGYSGTSAINDLNKLMGDLNGYEAFQDYGDITMDFSRSGIVEAEVTNYVRDLDMRTALSTVNYDYDGVHYTREYFNSYPDNVLAMKLSASEGGKVTVDLSMSLYYSSRTLSNIAEDDIIILKGELSSNKLKSEAQLKVIPTGGTMTANENGVISVTDADSVVLIFACGTDYVNEMPTYRGEDPHEAIGQRIQAAANKGYDAVKKDHVDDHSALFSRLELNLGEEIPQIPTDELIIRYRNTLNNTDGAKLTAEQQRAAEVMCYQFGRYLTIAGSREGALPTNLQGVWGIGSFAWYGDYHFNINVQMNYWPTMASNLAECLLPYNEYVETLRAPGRVAAASAFGIESGEGEENGWLVGCFSTAFGYAAMAQKGNLAGWNPTGSIWALQNVYEYYLFTGDVDYLRDNIYPSMKEVANFWTKNLWWSDYQQRYVSGPSYSPENGPIANGVSYDQEFIWQHFENTIQAAEILGVDEDLIAEWKSYQSKLNPVLIGDSGQVKEWFEETTFGKAQAGDLPETDIPAWRDSLGAGSVPHRHISQLVGLYPGTLINKDNQEYMDAAMVTLNERGLDATGWSKAHKLNLWARTGHAEEAYQLVRSAVGGNNAGILTTLLSSHGGGANYQSYPIFQIDGNFGLTAGINEMLIQSQLGYVEFLPTLPEEWNNGHVDGMVARGNFEIDMDWSDGKADKFVINSRIGGTFTGEYENLACYTVRDSNGEAVAIQILDRNKISFETKAGETYSIDFNNDSQLDVQQKLANYLIGTMTDPRLATAKTTLETALANATDAEVLAAANDAATGAMDLMNAIDAAKNFYEENKGAADTCAQAATAVNNLQKQITVAEALLDNAAATAEQFKNQKNALTSAQENITIITEQYGPFVDKIAEAEKCYADNKDKGTVWNNMKTAVEELSAAIAEAKAYQADAAATGENFVDSINRMNSAMKAIENLNASIEIEFDTTGGMLTLTTTDEQFEIRYTMDGNDVSIISALYGGTVALPKKTVTLQAALFIGDIQMSDAFQYDWNGGNLASAADDVTASTGQDSAYKAVDGNMKTYWNNWNGGRPTYPETLVLTYEQPVTFDQAQVIGYNYYNFYYATNIAVDYWDDEAQDWVEIGADENFFPNLNTSFTFTPVTTTKVRLRVLEARYNYFYITEFQISYSKSGTSADFAELNKVLEDAEAVRNGVYQNAGDEAKAAFDKWYNIASGVAKNEGSDQRTIDAAAEALKKAINAMAVVVTVKGADVITVDDKELTYTVSVSNTSGLATATFDMTVEGNGSEPEVEALNGWYIIAKTVTNGKLSVVMGNNAGVTGADSVDVLRVIFQTTGQRGTAKLAVDSAVLSSFISEGSEAFVKALLGNASVETTITYSTYDVNEDGVVDQLDITRAQRSYGASAGDSNWIAHADVNKDGIVDINDLILILNNYSKK